MCSNQNLVARLDVRLPGTKTRICDRRATENPTAQRKTRQERATKNGNTERLPIETPGAENSYYAEKQGIFYSLDSKLVSSLTRKKYRNFSAQYEFR